VCGFSVWVKEPGKDRCVGSVFGSRNQAKTDVCCRQISSDIKFDWHLFWLVRPCTMPTNKHDTHVPVHDCDAGCDAQFVALGFRV